MNITRTRYIQGAIFTVLCGIALLVWMQWDRFASIIQQATDNGKIESAGESVLSGDQISENTGESNFDVLRSTFHSLMTTVDFQCPKMQRFGRQGDGGYEVCMSKAIAPKRNSCLVYSFGVSNDWSFDENFAKYGCEVHSFDPSIGKEDHMHGPNISFHNLGLWGSDYVNSNGWKLEKLSTIKKRLGHDKRVIDVLKVDVEGAEWPFLRDNTFSKPNALSMVKQLLIELHNPRFRPQKITASDFAEINVYVRGLREDLGFQLYKNVQRNYCCGRFSDLMPRGVPEKCCHEVFFFNVHLLMK